MPPSLSMKSANLLLPENARYRPETGLTGPILPIKVFKPKTKISQER